ncbi:MAG: DUF177 domain-containing protein [Polyangiaceae bacterium]|nr:DUF177 domain-containing protein [Polyangiaceae bacterium]
MSPQYTVRVADLEDGPQTVTWELSEVWLDQALADSGAEPRGTGRAELTLTLSGREVLVKGQVLASLTMPCVVTLDPVPVEVAADLCLVLVPTTNPERGSHGARQSRGREGRSSASGREREGRRRDGSTRANVSGWGSDPTLSDEDASRDTYDGELASLDGFIREAILLELPMAPRRSDLPSRVDEATAHRPAESEAANRPPLDPRLMPLAAIASRMRKNKE